MDLLTDFILRVVVKGLLPDAVSDNFSDPVKFEYLISFVKRAINSSVTYVRGPEIFLRILLFTLIVILRLLKLVTFNYVSVSSGLTQFSKLHPLLDDGMRLYVLLAMFAAFEDDTMRISNGFASSDDLTRSFQKSTYND